MSTSCGVATFPDLRLTRAALFAHHTSELREALCAVARCQSDENAALLLQTAALVLGIEVLVAEDADETLVRAEPSAPLALDDAVVYAHEFATIPLRSVDDDGDLGTDIFHLPGPTLVAELGALCRRLLSVATNLSDRGLSCSNCAQSLDRSATAGATKNQVASMLVSLKAAAFVRALEALLVTHQGHVEAQMGVLKAFTFAAGVCVDWMASSSSPSSPSSSSPAPARAAPRGSVEALVSMQRAIDVLTGLEAAENDTKSNHHRSDADIETPRP
ncbi:MAG: hypothetical protein AAF715_32440 [Myxococcota bacterium]